MSERLVDLDDVATGLPFPFAAEAPIVCAESGGRLHVLAREPDSDHVSHVAFDRDGHVVGERQDVAASYVMGLAGGPDGLVAAVAMPDHETPGLAILAPSGELQQVTALELPGPQAVWPVPLAPPGRPGAVAATAEHLFLAQVSGEQIELGPGVPCGDRTVELAAAPAQGGAIVARVHGDEQALELLRIGPDGEERRTPVASARRAVLPAVSWVGDRLAVVWTSGPGGGALLQWHGQDLEPRGAPLQLCAGAPGERVRSARLLVGDPGLIAVSCVTQRPDEQVSRPSPEQRARPRRAQAYAHTVASFDPGSAVTGPPHPLAEPGAVFHTGAWVGDRLLALHGQSRPAVSVFAARCDPPPSPALTS